MIRGYLAKTGVIGAKWLTTQEMDDNPLEAVASLEELQTALESMSAADLKRLERYAGSRLTRIGPVAAGGLDPMDLVVEALEKARSGVRHWKKSKVDLVGLLAGIIKSQSSHRAKQAKRRPPPQTEADLMAEGEIQEIAVLEQVPASQANPEEELLDREEGERRRAQIARLDAEFSGDETIQLIMEGWKAGMKGPEIREWLRLSQKEYETETRRLRRRATAVAPQGGRHGGA
jgi:DNA-directed RNA polymerase specialized sigma24 family protein